MGLSEISFNGSVCSFVYLAVVLTHLCPGVKEVRL